jgi:hypothetical protein
VEGLATLRVTALEPSLPPFSLICCVHQCRTHHPSEEQAKGWQELAPRKARGHATCASSKHAGSDRVADGNENCAPRFDCSIGFVFRGLECTAILAKEIDPPVSIKSCH